MGLGIDPCTDTGKKLLYWDSKAHDSSSIQVNIYSAGKKDHRSQFNQSVPHFTVSSLIPHSYINLFRLLGGLRWCPPHRPHWFVVVVAVGKVCIVGCSTAVSVTVGAVRTVCNVAWPVTQVFRSVQGLVAVDTIAVSVGDPVPAVQAPALLASEGNTRPFEASL